MFVGCAVLIRGERMCKAGAWGKEVLFCSQLEKWWRSAMSNWPWSSASEHMVMIVKYERKTKKEKKGQHS